eukprot:3464881-Rhodomonas_salina.2
MGVLSNTRREFTEGLERSGSPGTEQGDLDFLKYLIARALEEHPDSEELQRRCPGAGDESVTAAVSLLPAGREPAGGEETPEYCQDPGAGPRVRAVRRGPQGRAGPSSLLHRQWRLQCHPPYGNCTSLKPHRDHALGPSQHGPAMHERPSICSNHKG